MEDVFFLMSNGHATFDPSVYAVPTGYGMDMDMDNHPMALLLEEMEETLLEPRIGQIRNGLVE